MPVYRRKDTGKWMVSLNLEGKRIRKTSPYMTKKDSQAYERHLRERHLDSLMSKDSLKVTATIEDFALIWLRDYAAINKRPSSLDGDERILRLHILPFFSGRELHQIEVQDVESFKRVQLEKGLKRKTIDNHLAVLSKMLKVAEEWGYQVRIPAMKWFRDRSQKIVYLSIEDANRLLTVLKGKWYVMVLTALRTGMRRGELIALQWRDIDFILNKITVARSDWKGHIGPTKGGVERVLPMSHELASALKKHRQNSPESKYVFCNEDGSRLKSTQMKRPIYRAFEKANLPRAQWHIFRHSFASHLVYARVGWKELQELLGHEDLKTTLRYAHLGPNSLSDAVEKLTDLSGTAKADPCLKVVEGSAK